MPFKSGEDWNGNANGRPKKFTIHDYITEKDVKSLVSKAKTLAKAGKTDMIKLLIEHSFGKPPQSVELRPDNNFINYYEELETEELIKIVESRKRASEESAGEKKP